MKVICLHHRLGGFVSHHFNEAVAFREELARRGTKFVLLVHKKVERPIVKALDARAVLDDDPTFRLEWSFEERTQRFVDMLHEHVDRRVSSGDRVLITIATQVEAHALVRWLQELPRRKKPWIVATFLSDRWNRSTSEEYERQMAELRTVRATIATLCDEDRQRLIFLSVTDRLAADLRDLLGVPVAYAPMPMAYPDPQPHPASSRPRVAILGGTRNEKGSYRIPDIIRACRSRVDVEFLVHVTNNSLSAEAHAKLTALAGEPHVTILERPLTLDEYNAALQSADLSLFPYEVIPYTKRSSGVFAEAVALNKPVLATRGTWMATQIEEGRAAGLVFDPDPDSIADSIARCVADLDIYRRSAESLSAAWREAVSVTTYVDILESQIASRPPIRRRWWW